MLGITTLLAISRAQVSAQSHNASTNRQCPNALHAIANGDFNSSGTIPINFESQDPWYYSLVFQERRSQNILMQSEQNIFALLSLPKSYIDNPPGNETRLCSYLMDGRNVTSDDNKNDTQSCSGTLSQECRQALQDIPTPSDKYCSFPGTEVEEACGLVHAQNCEFSASEWNVSATTAHVQIQT